MAVIGAPRGVGGISRSEHRGFRRATAGEAPQGCHDIRR
ncbi:hypothetical protein I547_5458 [Mycobacterium kansasii 824]|nr:hypothetical protein I547_5458 [Mycobacterium kansasii 824]